MSLGFQRIARILVLVASLSFSARRRQVELVQRPAGDGPRSRSSRRLYVAGARHPQLSRIRRPWAPGLRHRPRPPLRQADPDRRARCQGQAAQRQGHLRQCPQPSRSTSARSSSSCAWTWSREKLLWEKSYELGCDRMAMTPDGRLIFLPSFEGPLWYVVRAQDGEVVSRITPNSGSHNTIAGLGRQDEPISPGSSRRF